MNIRCRGLVVSCSLFFALALTAVSAAVPMGVYKGPRGGSTAPANSDYAGMRQFEMWLGHQIPRGIDFLSDDSWAAFDGSVGWFANLTSGWPPQRWRVTYSVPMLPKDDVSTLAQGADPTGPYDAHFTKLAEGLVAAGEGDAIIRLGWEMNGSWYRWSVKNSTDATDYIAYWKRIVDAMRAVSGANFKFDFCPTNGQPTNYASYHSYPGDDYVDIIGLDVYNSSYSTSDPATRWNELVNTSYGMQYWANFATTHGKQLSYPEWATGTRPGSTAGGGDDPLFIQNMFNWINSHNVAYHNYWDYPASDFNGQLSNNQFPNAGAMFKSTFGAAYAGQTPAPENLLAIGSDQTVALSWSSVSGATSYHVKRSTTIGHTFTEIATTTSPSYNDTGLTNGTSYYYVVTAVVGGTESAFSGRSTGIPIDGIVVDDSYPSGIALTGSWTSSTSGDGYFGLDYLHDGAASGGKSVQFTPNLMSAGSYNVYARWTSGSNRATNASLVVTSAGAPASFTIDQQFNGGGWMLLGTYSFNAGTAGNVLISDTGADGYVIADAVAFIAVSAPQPPPIVTGISGTPADSQVTVSWSAVSGATYTVKRAADPVGAYTTIASNLTTTSFVDTGLVNGIDYYYTVSATNGVGAGADATPVSVAPVGPPIAPAVTATPGDASVALSWTASPGATTYDVKRSTTAGGPYATVSLGSGATSFTDTSVTNLTTYYYVVSAVNSYGEGANSSEVSATPQKQFIIDNADPTGVTITGSWVASTSATTFYGSNYLHDNNTGITGGKSVRFTPTFPWAASADVYIRWTAGSNRASNAPIDVTSTSGTATLSADQKTNDGLWVGLGSFDFAPGTSGNVTVRNDGADGYVIADAVKFVITTVVAPATPAGLTAVSGDASVTLNWTPVSGAASYNVKRATADGGPYTTVAAGVTASSYAETGLTNGTRYYYVVSAVNPGGESANSSQGDATAGATAVTIDSVSSGKVYTLGTTAVGAIYTIDRTYTITALSSALTGRTMIRTAYDDKSLTTPTHLTFTLGQPADVYVCYDTRVTSLPAFLDGTWTLTSETFSATHTLASPFKVYRKAFPAGPVTLGANMQSPAAGSWGATAAHYVVILAPTS